MMFDCNLAASGNCHGNTLPGKTTDHSAVGPKIVDASTVNQPIAVDFLVFVVIDADQQQRTRFLAHDHIDEIAASLS